MLLTLRLLPPPLKIFQNLLRSPGIDRRRYISPYIYNYYWIHYTSSTAILNPNSFGGNPQNVGRGQM